MPSPKWSAEALLAEILNFLKTGTLTTSSSGGGGGGATTIANGADANAGSTTDAAVTTDAAGTLSAKLRGLIVLFVNFLSRLPAALGQGTMAQGLRVVLPTDQTWTGATNLGKAEDAVHASGDVGVEMLAVRQDTLAVLAANGDYIPLVVDANGNLYVTLGTRLDSTNDSVLAIKGSSLKTTYRTAAIGVAPAVAATNVFQLIGSATKTVKITKITVSGIATAAGAYTFAIRKQSAADTGGTSSAPAIVPLDSANAAGTAAAKAYTANPTAGTLVGNVAVKRATVTTAAGAIPNVPTEFPFGESVGQELTLRGVAQAMAISLEGATMTGGALDIEVEFTEE